MNLNIPDTRQIELARRLQEGQQIVATDVAREFDVSVDTIRRDILALEAEGKAHRVRGGAVPVAPPSAPIHERLQGQAGLSRDLIAAAIREITDAPTLLVDGGTAVLSVIEHLPHHADRLIMTPSPWVAITCQHKDIPVYLLGGRLRSQGGIATGEAGLAGVSNSAADIALLGACGLDAEFGLSTDDSDEAMMKRAMHKAATRTIVVTDASKLGRRARHHTLALADIDTVVTAASTEMATALHAAGLKVVTGS